MRKYVTRWKVISFLIVALLFICGCQSEELDYKGFDDKIIYNDEVDSFFHYYDGKELLISVSNRVEIGNGFRLAMKTSNFILYDVKKENIKKIYQVDMQGQAYSAVSYNDGIIYVDYRLEDSKFLWTIVQLKESGRTVIDEGMCYDFFQLPNITLIDNIPIYLYKNYNNKTSGINEITDSGVEKILDETVDWIQGTDMSTNSKEVCFIAVEGDESKIVVANTTGITHEIKLEGTVSSYTITQNNVLCSLHNDKESLNYDLLNYNLETKESMLTPLQKELYRLTGGSGKDAVCVDMNYNIYKVDVSAGKIIKIEAPSGCTGDAIAFLPNYNNKYIAGVLKNGRYSYYTMTIK